MRTYNPNLTTKENFEKKQGFFYQNSSDPPRIVDLNIPPFYGIKCNDLFSFEWNYITQGQAVQKIVKFEKAMVEKDFQVVISGMDDQRYLGNIEQFLQLTDVDINNVKMGKLWMDDYYLEGYIFASVKKKRYLGTNKTLINLKIICEKGNWQSEELWRFYAGGGGGSTEPSNENDYTGYGIIYPYEYPYDYSADFGTNSILNESYFDTDFEIIFYGPVPLPLVPQVTIGGYDYRINYELDTGDILIINSKKKTAIVTKADGEKVNVFKYRDRGWNLFEKIKSGGNLVIKDDSTAIDVRLFYERSEPKYTEEKWT